MKIKNIFILYCSLINLMLHHPDVRALSNTAIIQVNYTENGLLWEISGNGLNVPSYLFGTIHSSLERFFSLSDSVFIALEAAESFAGELNMDSLQYYIINLPQKNSSDYKTSEILSIEEYQKLDSIVRVKLGMSLESLPTEDPAMIAFALEKEEYKGDMKYFLDEYLYQIAKVRGKNIYGVETFDDQLNLLKSLTKEETRQLLLDQIVSDSEKQKEKNNILKAYEEQDLNQLKWLLENESEDEELELKILVGRNIKMADKIDQYLRGKSIFIAVGAAHLIGEKGLISLLREKGYTLRPVSITNTGLYRSYIDEMYAQPWVIYSPPSGGFSIEMPGNPSELPLKENIPGVKIESGMYAELGSETVYLVMKMIYPITIDESKKDFVYNSFKLNLSLNPYRFIGEPKEIIHDGLSGMELSAYVGKSISFSRIFIRDNSIYFIQIILPEEDQESSNVYYFFNSLKLLEE